MCKYTALLIVHNHNINKQKYPHLPLVNPEVTLSAAKTKIVSMAFKC